MINISLPDGSVRSFDKPLSGADIAAAIGPGLAKAALALRVDGKMVDLAHVVDRDARIGIVTARDPEAPPGLFDRLQLVLVLSALAVDAVALWAIAARIDTFGFTPNRVAALGENVILLVNLAWTAVLYGRFLRGGSLAALERWQTGYLPVYAAWAALVVILFPPLFHGL